MHMAIMSKNNKQTGFALVEMVLALAILALMFYVISKKYMTNSMEQDEETKAALASQGINTASLPAAVSKAQEAADKANKANKQIENAFNPPPGQN